MSALLAQQCTAVHRVAQSLRGDFLPSFDSEVSNPSAAQTPQQKGHRLMGRSLWSEDGTPLREETASADSDNRKKLRSTVLAAVSKYCSQDLKVQADCHVLQLIAIGFDCRIRRFLPRRCGGARILQHRPMMPRQLCSTMSSRRCHLQKLLLGARKDAICRSCYLEPANPSTCSCSAMLCIGVVKRQGAFCRHPFCSF